MGNGQWVVDNGTVHLRVFANIRRSHMIYIYMYRICFMLQCNKNNLQQKIHAMQSMLCNLCYAINAMPKMAQNGTKMAQNGATMRKTLPRWPKMAPRWFKMAARWVKMELSWLRIAPRWDETTQRWPKMAPRWPKMAPRWPSMALQSGFFVQKS